MGTTNFHFELPVFGAGSWHDQFFVGLPHSIETVLADVAGTAGGRTATVLSAFVGNSVRLSWLPFATPAFTTLSAAPIGAFVGSFQIVASGRAAYTRFAFDFYGPAHGQQIGGNFTDAAYLWRGIIMPGSIEVGGSRWVAKFIGTEGVDHDDGHRRVDVSALNSLGPGAYSIRFQVFAQLNSIATAPAGGNSAFILWPGHRALATVAEVKG